MSKYLVCAGRLILHSLPQLQNVTAAHSRLIADRCSQSLLEIKSVDTKTQAETEKAFRIG